MYTRCPHCLTVFVVAAEQLKAAHGSVRCGTCLESFDAIPHLSDGPMQGPAQDQGQAATPPAVAPAAEHTDPPPAAESDLESLPEIAFVPEEEEATPPTDDAVETLTPNEDDGGDRRSAAERLSSTLDAARAAAASGEADGGRAAVEDDSPPTAEPTPRREDVAAKRVSVLHEQAAGDDAPEEDAAELPEVLRQEVEDLAARTASRRRTVAYSIAALALLVLVAAQYVFFMPEDAVRRYPQWRGAIESVCIQFGCVLPERRDPGRIRVVTRDVRVHPKIEGVMQIKATLTNSAPYRQPYPLVRFTLFNVNGQTIATRDFKPSEYLGRPVAASARLRPKTPFQVELDVLAPEEAAVSFEFSFL